MLNPIFLEFAMILLVLFVLVAQPVITALAAAITGYRQRKRLLKRWRKDDS